MAMQPSTVNDALGEGRSLKRSNIRLITVFFMIYILVSGGSFGIEDMVSSSGPGLTILLLVLLPVFWSLPMALVASELGSALPGEGGFYVLGATRARRLLGLSDGLVVVAVDLRRLVRLHRAGRRLPEELDALRPVLVLRDLLGDHRSCSRLVNIYGVQLVALGSSLFSVLIIAPFVVLIVVGLAKWQFDPLTPFTPPGVPFFGTNGALGLGLAIGVWMYSGYESMSTLSGEIRNPQRDHSARPHAGRALHHRPVRAADRGRARRLRPLGRLGHRRRAAVTSRSSRSAASWAARRSAGPARLGAARQPGPLPRLPGFGSATAVRALGRRPVSQVDLEGEQALRHADRRHRADGGAQRRPHHRAVPEPRRHRRHPVHLVLRRSSSSPRRACGPRSPVSNGRSACPSAPPA